MFSNYLSQTDLLIWPLIALAIFFSVFVGVLVHVFLGRVHGPDLSHVSALPLDADDEPISFTREAPE